MIIVLAMLNVLLHYCSMVSVGKNFFLTFYFIYNNNRIHDDNLKSCLFFQQV